MYMQSGDASATGRNKFVAQHVHFDGERANGFEVDKAKIDHVDLGLGQYAITQSIGGYPWYDHPLCQTLHRYRRRGEDGAIPRDFLILPLSRLYCQTFVVHLVYVARSLHVAQDVVLKFRHRLQRIWRILILLDIADDLCSFRAFGKVNVVCPFDDRRDAVLDEGQVGKVDA